MMSIACYCTGACRVPPYRCVNAPEQYSIWGASSPPQPLNRPTTPTGCICPPTSEQTCEAPSCPRQNPYKQAQKRASQFMQAVQSNTYGGDGSGAGSS